MKISITGFLLILLSSAVLNVHGQTTVMKGRIENQTEGEVAYVSLHSAADSALVKDVLTENDGSFLFDSVYAGRYIVAIQYYNHLDYWSAPVSVDGKTKEIDLGQVYLEPEGTVFEEVVITATKPFLQRKIDRIVVNPDVMISNVGNSVLEVLEKTPGVNVTPEGIISMKGKSGVQVYIDDKPTYLSNEELASYLRTLPAGTIETIELMTNPPAKYDAEGNAGIININLKKSSEKGFNIGLNLGYSQGRYAKIQNSLHINYRVNKLNITANLGMSQLETYQDLDINRYYFNHSGDLNSSFHQNSYIKRKEGGRNVRMGVDYYATKKSTFGMVLSGFMNPEKGMITNKAFVLNKFGDREVNVESYKPSEERWNNGSVNLNYTYKVDDKGKELSANADYIRYESNMDQVLENGNYSTDGTLIDRSLLEFYLPASINITSMKLDYSQPVGARGKIDGGIRWGKVTTDNDAQVYDNIDGVQVVNNEFTNRFNYEERIAAGYLNYAYNSDRLSVQLGVRMENTASSGIQFGNAVKPDSSFHFRYNSLFPTLYALYKLDTAYYHQLALSLGRRISRPQYHDLNPFTFPIDRYTYYMGNPFLQPTFSYGGELSYTFKSIVTATFEYTIVENPINETNEQVGTIYYSRPGNLGNHSLWGITISGRIPITDWWTLQLYSESKNAIYKTTLYDQAIDERRWYWYFSPVNQFKIDDKWSAELSGSYQTSILVAQFLTIPVWQARAAMSYSILKGAGSIKVSLSDIFYSNQPGGEIRYIANSKADWLSHLDTRVLGIGFSYRFSKGNTMQLRKSGASDQEKERVKG